VIPFVGPGLRKNEIDGQKRGTNNMYQKYTRDVVEDPVQEEFEVVTASTQAVAEEITQLSPGYSWLVWLAYVFEQLLS
jgi:hypothetical protein